MISDIHEINYSKEFLFEGVRGDTSDFLEETGKKSSRIQSLILVFYFFLLGASVFIDLNLF